MEHTNSDNSIGTQIGKVFRHLRHLLQKKFKDAGYDLTLEQWLILILLKIKNNRNQQELAEACDKEKTTITRLIDNLYKNGLVNRIQDTNDRRNNIISITEKGYKVESILTPIGIKVNEKALEGFSEDEIRTFLNMLNRISKNLTDEN